MQKAFDNVAEADHRPDPLDHIASIELDTLLRDYLLGLVLIAGANDNVGSTRVQWVHSSDLDDPTPFLTPRTVLLTTGTQFTTAVERADADLYVQRLLSAGTTALGVAVGVHWDRIPPELIAACDRHQLPLFRVPYDTPFIAITRTAARLIEAEVHAAQRTRANLGDTSSVFRRRQALAEAESELRTAVAKLIFAGQHFLAQDVSAAILPRLPRENLSVVCFSRSTDPKTTTTLNPLLLHTDGVFVALRGELSVVLCESATLSAVLSQLESQQLAAGVSERGNIDDINELTEQASRALEMAHARRTHEAVLYRPAMHAGVLQVLRSSPEALRAADGLLAPVRRHDERHNDDIEVSLRTWLNHHGQASAAASELNIHRHTLSSKVRIAAELLQRDLSTADSRAEVWAALSLSATHERQAGTK